MPEMPTPRVRSADNNTMQILSTSVRVWSKLQVDSTHCHVAEREIEANGGLFKIHSEFVLGRLVLAGQLLVRSSWVNYSGLTGNR